MSISSNILLEVGAPDDVPGASITLPFMSSGCPSEMRGYSWELARFLRIDKIDSGFASHVYKVVDTRSNRTAALKVYDKRALSAAIEQAVMQEISIHGRLSHPHLVSMYAAFEDGPFLCILMELAPDGSLYRRMSDIKRSEEAVAKYILGPLLSVLGYMHHLSLMHRDIKPENILLRSSHILLSDLGFAVNYQLQRPVTQLGTMHFMAPEICTHDPWDPSSPRRSKVPRAQRRPYGPAVDVWAVGCVAYELLCKKPLFKGRTEDEVLDSIVNLTPASLPDSMSPEARDFLAHCLVCEPEWRATAEELYSHEFIVGHMGREKHERLDPARLAEEWALPRASNGLQMESPGSGIGGSMLLTVRGSSHSAQRHVWGPSSNADAHVQRKAMHSQVPMMASVLMESSTLGALRRQSTGFADGIFGRESAGLPGQARSLGWLGVGQGAAPIPDDVLGAGGPAMVGSAPIKGTGTPQSKAMSDGVMRTAGRGYASSGASMAVPVGMTSPALRHQGGESPSSGRQGAEQHLPGIDGEEAHDVKPRRGLLAKLFGRRKGRTTAAAPDGGSHVGDRDRRPQSEMGNATQPVHTRVVASEERRRSGLISMAMGAIRRSVEGHGPSGSRVRPIVL